MARIFLCSSYSEFRRERNLLAQLVRDLGLLPLTMERFGARTLPPIEVCLAEVEAADILIILLGESYGSMVPGRGISFSQCEYERAFELGKTILVYRPTETAMVDRDQVESEPGRRMLREAFHTTIGDRHTIKTFVTVEDLVETVALDLARLVEGVDAQVRQPADSPSDALTLDNERPSLTEQVRRHLAAGEQQAARRAIVARLLDNEAEAHRFLGLLSVGAGSDPAAGVSNLLAAADAGDRPAERFIRALLLCSPSWIDLAATSSGALGAVGAGGHERNDPRA